MKQPTLLYFLLLASNSFSQTHYQDKIGTYSFEMPDTYKKQKSAHEVNEFVFTNNIDTTSLVINIAISIETKEGIIDFKKATNKEVETNYFKILKNPKIVNRGELDTYKDQSIYFHLQHTASAKLENDFMLIYIFFHKGKEINFIFRTKERRLEKIMEDINTIVNSVKLI
jgi:mRNA-degrading endonuclease YafQ of YafQ-DinJ toxin-antitoxin module